jgi:glycine/D-amino acid oxidase-like deaminating enzyme
MSSVGTLIIGAGVAGASLAASLAERGAGADTSLVDIDVFGKYNSSELNGGGVRATFAEPINIKLSLHSIKYYQQHAKALDFRQRGYLWMYDESLWEDARTFLPLVRSFGLPVEELTPDQLKDRYSFLGDVSDLAGATRTPMDGRLSPHRLRIHYLNLAQSGGVQLLDRWQVTAVDGVQSPYRVTLKRVGPRGVKRALTEGPAKIAEELIVQAQRIVNAAGPWAPRVAQLYGRSLPITPLPRQVFLLRHSEINLEPHPFFIDYPQDIYFRHYERDRQPCTLVSWSDPDEKPGINFANHGEDYYRTHVQPLLACRIPAMQSAALAGGWVGHYELSADKSAIVGPVPSCPGVFNLNGLSAHGVMQSRALGEALAGFILEARWPAGLDLNELAESRFTPALRISEKMYV